MPKNDQDRQQIERAFTQAREPHVNQIQRLAHDASHLIPMTYNYHGKGYSESNGYTHPNNHLGIEQAWTDEHDAILWRINEEARQNELKADVVVRSESGSTDYSSVTDRSPVYYNGEYKRVEPAYDVTIVRKDAEGREVYRTRSESRALAEKVGALAAKKIIKSVTNNEQDKSA